MSTLPTVQTAQSEVIAYSGGGLMNKQGTDRLRDT